MMPEMKLFHTYDVDLAAFLMTQGLKFYECKQDPIDRTRALFSFFDDKGIGRDLERSFMSSESKRFSDLRKYLLREVHRTLKGIK